LKSVGYLAAVDGAVLLDSQLRVLGFGAFVNIPDQQDKVAYRSAEGVDMVEPRQLGGGRHRSALQFCREYAPAAAVVVSEDGRITVMKAGPDRKVMCAPISVLGFSGSIIPSR
jgi:DNA integrity scanning protein DisA with diadenylate cyclase activity